MTWVWVNPLATEILARSLSDGAAKPTSETPFFAQFKLVERCEEPILGSKGRQKVKEALDALRTAVQAQEQAGDLWPLV